MHPSRSRIVFAAIAACCVAGCAAGDSTQAQTHVPSAAQTANRPAPDEGKLGKQRGYPIGTARTWFFDESVRVGSFTAQAEIPGIANDGVHTLDASAAPMRLPRAKAEPAIRWDVKDERALTIDDYLARQRIMGLLIIKDGEIQLERYQYERKPEQRFVSQSMAKSILSLGFGIALREGRIKRPSMAMATNSGCFPASSDASRC